MSQNNYEYISNNNKYNETNNYINLNPINQNFQKTYEIQSDKYNNTITNSFNSIQSTSINNNSTNENNNNNFNNNISNYQHHPTPNGTKIRQAGQNFFN
jgi:hypothetical protein